MKEGQKKYIEYCAKARIEPPHFGQHSISVMSSGSEFRPCHFVTLWAALTSMTQGATVETDWSIVKV